MANEHTFKLSDVVALGFEASCVSLDGTVYFWHRNFGVRIDRRTGKMALVTDPKVLPDGDWTATRVGVKELEAARQAV